NKKDINEYKADEHEGGIESNKILLDNKIPLEIFKENKDKIPYYKSYKSITRIYNDLQKEKRKEK
ncbi:40043_t:CDS:1, partial [Gigaspora margarita]